MPQSRGFGPFHKWNDNGVYQPLVLFNGFYTAIGVVVDTIDFNPFIAAAGPQIANPAWSWTEVKVTGGVNALSLAMIELQPQDDPNWYQAYQVRSNPSVVIARNVFNYIHPIDTLKLLDIAVTKSNEALSTWTVEIRSMGYYEG